MKTTTIIILGLLLITKLGCCADSLNIVDTTKIWSVLVGEFVNGSREITHYYKFKNDSNINGKQYKLIYESYDTNLVDWQFTSDLIREDSNKVFLYRNNNEQILYDFSLMKGDTVTLNNMFDQENDWVVDSIDYVEVNGKMKKRIYLSLHDYLIDSWIEGLGSTLGILFSGNFMPDFNTNLLCILQNENIIYSNPLYSTCYIYTGINSTKNYNDLKIYPTIIDSWINIDTKLYQLNLQVISLAGKTVYNRKVDSNTINISEIESGFYILKFTDMNENMIWTFKIIKI